MPFKIAVVCTHCQVARDLDLCKDVVLLSPSDEDETVWPCPVCKHSVDKSIIEGTLIETVQRQLGNFVLQDLRCLRCSQVKSSELSLRCECSGSYRPELAAADWWRRVRTIHEIAEYYKFERVREMAEECLKSQ